MLCKQIVVLIQTLDLHTFNSLLNIGHAACIFILFSNFHWLSLHNLIQAFLFSRSASRLLNGLHSKPKVFPCSFSKQTYHKIMFSWILHVSNTNLPPPPTKTTTTCQTVTKHNGYLLKKRCLPFWTYPSDPIHLKPPGKVSLPYTFVLAMDWQSLVPWVANKQNFSHRKVGRGIGHTKIGDSPKI